MVRLATVDQLVQPGEHQVDRRIRVESDRFFLSGPDIIPVRHDHVEESRRGRLEQVLQVTPDHPESQVGRVFEGLGRPMAGSS